MEIDTPYNTWIDFQSIIEFILPLCYLADNNDKIYDENAASVSPRLMHYIPIFHLFSIKTRSMDICKSERPIVIAGKRDTLSSIRFVLE